MATYERIPDSQFRKEKSLEIKVGTLYKTSEGNHCRVVALAKHPETREDLVVYEEVKILNRSILPIQPKRDVWAEPVSIWIKKVSMVSK